MAKILRGDVRWADLNPILGHEQGGQRPVLVLSHDILNLKSATAIVMAMTSQKPKVNFPLAMELTSIKLPKPSWVKMNQIRTVSVKRLGKRLGSVSEKELRQVVEGLFELIN